MIGIALRPCIQLIIHSFIFQIYVRDVLVDLPVDFVGSYANDFEIAHGVTRNQCAKSWCDLVIVVVNSWLWQVAVTKSSDVAYGCA